MTRPHLLPLLLVVLGLSACAVRIGPLHEYPAPVAPTTPAAEPEPPLTPPRLCADAHPPKLFVALECEAGICGFTCAPDRWAAPPSPPPTPPPVLFCCPLPTPPPASPPKAKPAPAKGRGGTKSGIK